MRFFLKDKILSEIVINGMGLEKQTRRSKKFLQKDCWCFGLVFISHIKDSPNKLSRFSSLLPSNLGLCFEQPVLDLSIWLLIPRPTPGSKDKTWHKSNSFKHFFKYFFFFSLMKHFCMEGYHMALG